MLNRMPGLMRLVHYNRLHFTGDMTAGLTVAMLLVPQSMAYAMIAGVPITAGLFAAAFPPIIYAFIGGSSYLSVGPVSIVSLMSFSGVSAIAQPNSHHFLELMVMLALMVAGIQLFWV